MSNDEHIYDLMRAEVERLAERESVSEGVAAQMLMTFGVLAVAREVPPELRHALALVCARWLELSRGGPSLEDIRVLCWRFLEEKNGYSAVVSDRQDAAVRALICVLWDEAHEDDEMEMGVEYFAGLVSLLPGLGVALGSSMPPAAQ